MAFPVLVTGPVRFALVVTLPAVNPLAVPVMFVPTSAEGVPRFGVVNTAFVVIATLPVPLIALLTRPFPLSVNTACDAVSEDITGCDVNVCDEAKVFVVARPGMPLVVAGIV